MSTLRVLWVTEEIPDLRLGGGSIRQFHLLTALAAKADVEVLALGRLPDPALRRSLAAIEELDPPARWGRRREWVRFRAGLLPGLLPAEVAVAAPARRALSGPLLSRLARGGYDVVQVEHETLAPLVRARPGRAGPAWSVTLHNLLSVRLRQAAAATAKERVRWLCQRDAGNAERLERSLRRDYEQVITVSPADAAAIGGATVVPNGVDLDAFRPSPLPAEPRLILTASWNWQPNVDAARWAATELLPRVRARVAGASLLLVGRQPNDVVRGLGSLEGVETHFDVESVVPHLRSARVAVVPLSVGSGTRLKALEALASGRPVVGTAIGLDGLGLVDGDNARVATSADDMARAVAELLTDDRIAGRLAAAGRAHVERHFGWEAFGGQLFEALSSAARRR